MRPKSESNDLSYCESMVMKLVWDAGKDISVQELITQLRERYNKDYARTTVVTFLGKISEKGYITTYRKGKNSYIHAEKDEDWYKKKKLNEETRFWYEDDPVQLISALCESRKITGDEITRMRKLLNELDA